MDEKKLITTALLNDILNYLVKQAYQEVHHLVSKLLQEGNNQPQPKQEDVSTPIKGE